MTRGMVVIALIIGMATPASAAGFKNCAALQAKHPHGIAKSSSVIAKATGLTGRPTVSAKLYQANKSKDRDGDGVACEA